VGRPVAVTLLALACAGVAFAANGQPRKQHTAADMAKARSVVLRAADFGAGWKSSPSSPDSGTPRCKGFAPDESDLVETGSADSPEFEKGLRYVSSSAAVFKTAAQAQASWNRVVKPGLLDCLGSLFDKGASGSSVTIKVVGKSTLAFPRLAPRAAAYRLSFAAKSQGLTLRGAVDLILLGKGRIDALMISVAFGTPPLADERRLAGLIAGRLS
jgi:hypothetical protein